MDPRSWRWIKKWLGGTHSLPEKSSMGTDYVLFAVALILLGSYAFLMAPSQREDVVNERAYITGTGGLQAVAESAGGGRRMSGGGGGAAAAATASGRAQRHIRGVMRNELVAVKALSSVLTQLKKRLENADDLTYVPWDRPSAAVEAARAAVMKAGQPRIPRIVHQVYGLYGDAPPVGMDDSIESFKSMNPNHTHILWNASDIQVFVESYWPSLAPAFRRLRMPVLKADISRYLLMYTFGGVYSDIDTECLKPIDTWDDGRRGVSLIVGVEADGKDVPEWNKSYGRQLQFCQWTIAAAPQHAMLGLVIHRIARKLAAVDVENITLDQVTHTTGPTVWTDGVNDYIRLHGHTWKEYLGMSEAQLVGDMLLLTITGFSPSVGHMGAKTKYDNAAKVMHYFDGSWTGRPRKNHSDDRELDALWDRLLADEKLVEDLYY